MTGRPLPYLPARTFAALAVASATFTLYGSLVPFHYHSLSFAEAVPKFQQAMVETWWPSSRSDFAANLLLGVPLGFGLLAALRLDRPPDPLKTAFYALAVWPWTVVFAAGVEFSQLFFDGRTCAGSDVLAQSLGSAAGLAVWMIVGPELIRWLRGAWASPQVGGTAGRLLIVYLGLLALAQTLPLDLTASPYEVYHKKWKERPTVLVPFSEPVAEKLPVWMQLGGLYTIAGLLAAGVPTLRGLRVVGFALLLAVGLESAQLLVKSRTTSATDVVIGTSAVCGGWLVGRLLRGRTLSLEFGLILVQIWAAGLIVGGWLPFDFDPAVAGKQWAAIEWTPFAVQIEKSYMSSLEEMVTKTLLFAPVGAVAGGVGGRAWLGAVGAVLLSALIEGGQVYLPGRLPGPTDLLFAAVGGWLGATAVHRLLGDRPGRRAGPRTQLTLEVTA